MMDRLKAAMVSRVTQLVARYVAFALACWLGYDTQHAEADGFTIAAAVGAVLAGLIDHLIHNARAKLDAPPVPDWWKKLGVLAVLSLPLCHAGCAGLTPPAQSPLERADAINRSLVLVLDALSEARSLGYLSDDDARALVPYVDSANRAARTISRLAREGAKDEPFGELRTALHAFADAFDVLLRAKMEASETKGAVDRARSSEPVVPAE